jgi:acrylyl-CoA reductase (NADPH)
MQMPVFKALRLSKTEGGQAVEIVDFDEADLMDGDVTVRVSHSTVNYKDGLGHHRKGAGGAALADDSGH